MVRVNDGPPLTDGQGCDSERRFDRMQVENRDVAVLWRRESNRNQRLFELITRPAALDVLRRFPDANDEKCAIPDRAVVPQLAKRSCPSAAHDQRVCSVIRLCQLVDIAIKAGNQERSHSLSPGRSSLLAKTEV